MAHSKFIFPVLLIASAANVLANPPSLDQIESKYSRSAESNITSNIAQNARMDAVRDSAKSVGIQAGINYQLYQINQAIKKHERDLDTIYDFGYLMIQGRVVPPVITEVRDMYNQDSNLSLKLSGVTYQIEEQARFSSVPPNWRSYLKFGEGSDDFTKFTMGLRVQGEEKYIFQNALKAGWHEGIEQANVMLKYGLDRLNRDYNGMLRFNTFVMQGKISMPIIASADIPMTVTSNTLTLDEQLLRITVLPSFNGNIDKWKAWVVPSKQFVNMDSLKQLDSIAEKEAKKQE